MFEQLKEKVKSAKARAVFKVNQELILMYHYIGTQILSFEIDRDKDQLIKQLSKDFKEAFSDMEGYSEINLGYMRKFAQEYPEVEFVQEVLAQLPWSHHQILLSKVPDKETRHFYIQNAIEHAWTRETMTMHIEAELHNAKNNK